MNLKFKKKKGFTLIELVIVIVIIGILIMLAALKYKDITETASDKVAMSNLKSLKTAVALYQTKHSGTLPTKMEDIKDSLEKNALDKNSNYSYSFDGTILKVTKKSGNNKEKWGVKQGVEGTYYEVK